VQYQLSKYVNIDRDVNELFKTNKEADDATPPESTATSTTTTTTTTTTVLPKWWRLIQLLFTSIQFLKT